MWNGSTFNLHLQTTGNLQWSPVLQRRVATEGCNCHEVSRHLSIKRVTRNSRQLKWQCQQLQGPIYCVCFLHRRRLRLDLEKHIATVTSSLRFQLCFQRPEATVPAAKWNPRRTWQRKGPRCMVKGENIFNLDKYSSEAQTFSLMHLCNWKIKEKTRESWVYFSG